MRVRIAYSVDVGDDYRRAINDFYGKPGLATRQEVKDWLRAYGDSMDDDLMRPSKEEELEMAFGEQEGN